MRSLNHRFDEIYHRNSAKFMEPGSGEPPFPPNHVKNNNDHSSDHIAPTNMLERVLHKAVQDPALHGKMFRLILDSELILIVPADQPLLKQGADRFTAENPLQVSRFADAGGPFCPVFTSLTAADRKISLLPNRKEFKAVGISARAALQLVYDGETPVRLISQGPAQFFLPPEAIKALLDGDLTEADPNEREQRRTTLTEIDATSLPPRLLDGIRKFCDTRPVPLGIYAFAAQLPDSEEWDYKTIHFFLWLRETDRSFYNDFQLMAQSLGQGFDVTVNVTSPESLDFITSTTPLWPIIETPETHD